MKLKRIFATVMILAVLFTAVFCTAALAANEPVDAAAEAAVLVDSQAQVTSSKAIACAIIIAVGSGLGALSMALASRKASDGISRQPEAAGNIRSTMIIAMALMEALTIYGLLIAFMLIGKI